MAFRSRHWWLVTLLFFSLATATSAQDSTELTVAIARFEPLSGQADAELEARIANTLQAALSQNGVVAAIHPDETARELLETNPNLDLIVGGHYERVQGNRLNLYGQVYHPQEGRIIDGVKRINMYDRLADVAPDVGITPQELNENDDTAVDQFTSSLARRVRANPSRSYRPENVNESVLAEDSIAGRSRDYLATESGEHAADEVFRQLENQEVISATRTRTRIKDAPAAVYVINERQIRERGYRTLVDALYDIPGFDIIHNYGIFPELIHQRGLVGNNQRTLVYVDGVLDNNITENAALGGTLRFPLHNVERIEVVAGPSSALYGANAFNGIINIITKDGSRSPGTIAEVFGGHYESDFRNPGAGGSVTSRGGTSLGETPFLYSASAYYYKTQGPRFDDQRHLRPDDYNPNDVEYYIEEKACGQECNPDGDSVGYYWSPLYDVSPEDTYNVTARFSAGGFRFQTVNWQYLQGQGTFSNATQTIDTNKGDYEGSAWNFRNNSATLGYLHELGDTLSLDSEIGMRHTEVLSSSHEQVPDETGPYYYYRPGEFTTVSDYARPDVQYTWTERLEWKPGSRFTTTLGGEAQYTVVPQGYGEEARYKYRNYAGYLQQLWKPLDWLALTGGYRYDYNSIYGISHTPRIGTILSPTESLTVKALYSSGFRGPTAWESFNATRQRRANPDLKPERMRTVELGLGYRFSKRYYVSVHSYYTRIRDLLLEVETNESNPNVPGSNWNQNQNVGRARIVGTEAEGDFQIFDSFNIYANYSYTKGEYRDLPDTLTSSPSTLGRPGDDLIRDYIRETMDREIAPEEGPIPNVAQHHYNMGFTWYILRYLSWHVRLNYVDIRRTIAANPEETIEGYVMYHMNLRWEDPWNRDLYVELLVRNLGNEQFYDPGIRTATGSFYPTRHPLEGRNIWLTLGYRF